MSSDITPAQRLEHHTEKLQLVTQWQELMRGLPFYCPHGQESVIPMLQMQLHWKNWTKGKRGSGPGHLFDLVLMAGKEPYPALKFRGKAKWTDIVQDSDPRSHRRQLSDHFKTQGWIAPFTEPQQAFPLYQSLPLPLSAHQRIALWSDTLARWQNPQLQKYLDQVASLRF